MVGLKHEISFPDRSGVSPPDSLLCCSLQAWMRARGDSATEVLTAETMADKYGVQQGSYDAVPLPTNVDVQQARHALLTPRRGLRWHPQG